MGALLFGLKLSSALLTAMVVALLLTYHPSYAYEVHHRPYTSYEPAYTPYAGATPCHLLALPIHII